MPWSDWIQSDDYYAGTSKSFNRENYGAFGGIVGFGPVGGAMTGASSLWTPPPPFGQGERNFIIHEATTAWVTARDWSPPELDALTEGTDYAPRPGSTPGDVDEFIEYESDGDNTFTGWEAAIPGVTPVAPTMVSNYGAGIPFGLYMVDGATNPVPFPADEPLPIGTLFATGNTADAVGTTYALPPLPVGPVWTYVMRLGAEPDEPTTANVEWASPALTYRMPRWRYWIPGSQLRQFHRDRGGMTPRRHFGGTDRGTNGRAFGSP